MEIFPIFKQLPNYFIVYSLFILIVIVEWGERDFVFIQNTFFFVKHYALYDRYIIIFQMYHPLNRIDVYARVVTEKYYSRLNIYDLLYFCSFHYFFFFCTNSPLKFRLDDAVKNVIWKIYSNIKSSPTTRSKFING